MELPNIATLAQSIEAAAKDGVVDGQDNWDGEWEEAEEWEGEGDEGAYEEEEVDAEDVAQRLRDGIWAELAKARAAAEAPAQPVQGAGASNVRSVRKEATLANMRTLLRMAGHNPHAHLVLGAPVPALGNASILEALSRATTSGKVSRHTAGVLSQVIVAVLQSGMLNTPAPPVQMMSVGEPMESTKRKPGSEPPEEARPTKRPAHYPPAQPSPQTRFENALAHSVATLTQRLREKQAKPDSAIDPQAVEPHINRIWRFASTALPKDGPLANDIAEVVGLMQVLSAVIGCAIIPLDEDTPAPEYEGRVHFCLVRGCDKCFTKVEEIKSHSLTHEEGAGPESVEQEIASLPPDALRRMQTLVRALRPVLQTSIGNTPVEPPTNASALNETDAATSQATLAQALAEAQSRTGSATPAPTG